MPPLGAFGRGDDGEECVGEHGQNGPAMPRGPAADLVLIQSSQAFAGLEGFFDAPSGSGHADQYRAAATGVGA